MAVIAIDRFHLADGVDPQAFAASNQRVAIDYVARQPGYMGTRYAVHSDQNEWVGITESDSAASADASMAKFMSDPVNAEFVSGLDPATVTMERYDLVEW